MISRSRSIVRLVQLNRVLHPEAWGNVGSIMFLPFELAQSNKDSRTFISYHVTYINASTNDMLDKSQESMITDDR